MKKLSFLFSFLLFSVLLIAQKKSLPTCTTVATEIEKINSSFDEMVLNAKKVTDYPQMTICGIPGYFDTLEGYAEFTFKFSDDDYAGKKAAFNAYFEKIYQALKTTLSASHNITGDSSKESRSFYFEEKGKPWQESRMSAYLYVTYVDYLTELPKFGVELKFKAKLK